MKERKNIDRLFQEKFKDFEAHPSDRVWQNIASAKAQKEDRKVLPLWWRIGGIAAALLLLLALGNSLLQSNTDTDTPLVNTEIEDSTPADATPLAVEQAKKELPLEKTNDDGSQVTSTSSKDNSSQTQLKLTTAGSNNTQGLASAAKTVIANKEQTPSNRLKQDSGIETSQKATLAQTETLSQNPATNRTTIKKESSTKNNLAIDRSQEIGVENAVAVGQDQPQSDPSSKAYAQDDQEKKSLVAVAEEINRNKTEEDALASTTTTKPDNKWRVGAVAAPVYYGDFGGSGIDPQFKDNSKSGDVNLSYGVQVSYAVSDKIKLRTGVNNVDLSYGTNDISFRPDIAATKLAGVTPNRNGKFLSVSDKVGAQALQSSDFQGGGSTVSNGSINQQIGYIEVPLEAVYVLSNKRLGVEVIGGVSTLFVNDNEIAIEADGLRTPIGASSSLNEVSFTTNIGVGLNYKVTEKVDINMEPTLKYQLNAFEASAGNFKPYYVGLYTGVSYRF